MIYNEVLNGLKRYEEGKSIDLIVREYGIKPEDVIKLASNENPLGSSPMAIKALNESINLCAIYPDDSYFELKRALCDKFNIKHENIIIGVGSDQVIEMCVLSVANKQRGILTAGVTFAMYEIYAMRAGAKVFRTNSQSHNLDEFKKVYTENKDKIGIVFLCVPNNPLGECLDASDVYDFIKFVDKDTLVVVDGAYQEYASYKDLNKAITPKKLVDEFENVIYLGTFSKAYGLAGLRIGYGLANSELISEINKLRSPMNAGILSAKAATAALKDCDFINQSMELNFSQMPRYEALADELGIEYIQSFTNFIIYKFKNTNASDVVNAMLKKGIILRDMRSYGLNALRITIGTSSQNDKVINELRDLIGNKK